MTVVIGVDPGKSTGLAALHNGRLELALQGVPQVINSALIDYLVYVQSINVEDVTIAYERYTIVPRPGGVYSSQSDALRVIGMLELIAQHFNCGLASFPPSTTKAFASNALLRKLGLYVSSTVVKAPDARDVNDAVRVALVCLAHENARLYRSMLDAADIIDPLT